MLSAFLTQCLPQMKQVPKGFDTPLSMEEVEAVIHESSVITIMKREGVADEEAKKRPSGIGAAPAKGAAALVNDPENQSTDSGTDVSIYEYGVPTQFFTVVLEGKVEVLAGREKYRTVVGKLGLLAANAILLDETAAADAVPVSSLWEIFGASFFIVSPSVQANASRFLIACLPLVVENTTMHAFF